MGANYHSQVIISLPALLLSNNSFHSQSPPILIHHTPFSSFSVSMINSISTLKNSALAGFTRNIRLSRRKKIRLKCSYVTKLWQNSELRVYSDMAPTSMPIDTLSGSTQQLNLFTVDYSKYKCKKVLFYNNV